MFTTPGGSGISLEAMFSTCGAMSAYSSATLGAASGAMGMNTMEPTSVSHLQKNNSDGCYRMEEERDGSSGGMSVADVRKGLLNLRESWKRHSPDTPICLSVILSNGMSMEGFAHRFVLGHHNKRHQKAKSSRTSGQEADHGSSSKRRRLNEPDSSEDEGEV